jgi:hypothetical protein
VLVSVLCLESTKIFTAMVVPKEQIGRKADHGFHIVVIHQILADFFLSSATVKNTGKADNGRTAFTGEIT